MPETVSGPSGVPSRGDSGQAIRDTLARLEAKIDRLAEQMADAEAEAEEIMRRAAAPSPPVSPRRRASSPRRRGDTFLRVVKGVAVVAAILTLALAAMHPGRMKRERWAPRCAVSCVRPVAHHSRAGR